MSWFSSRSGLATLAMAVLCTAVAPAAAQAPPLAAAEPKVRGTSYVGMERMTGAQVSPDNRHVAFLLTDDRGRHVLAISELAKPGDARVIAAVPDGDVHHADWVNEKRLIYTARMTGETIVEGEGGTFAIDIDGARIQHLVSWTFHVGRAGTRFKEKLLPYGWFFHRSLRGRGDEVLMEERNVRALEDRGIVALARLDTATGQLTRVDGGMPSGALSHVFDRNGDLRIVTTIEQDRHRVHHRAPGSSGWVVVEDRPVLDGGLIDPLFIEADGTWVVRSSRGRDTEGLFSYDPQARRLLPEPLVAVDGFDVRGAITFDEAQQLISSAWVRADRWQPVWFDEKMAKVQKEIDASLPAGRVNQVRCGDCATAARFVVESSSDRVPAEFYVYDRASRRLTQLGRERPWLAEGGQGRRSFHRVAARDGLSLPVIVTHPAAVAAGTPAPTVVYVHGGPWLRGADTGWSAEPQFLAAHGWRVLEVEFRGSFGFGQKHFRAGWRQWGQAMQDDLADAVAWAVREKLADPGRVCIVGGSYGGYAALMGPVRHPGTYRCAASFAGVTDLTKMYSGFWTDIAEHYRRYNLTQLLGDERADAEMLRRFSPINRVAEIKVPLFLAHGKEDRRVDIAHTERFATAAREAGLPVEVLAFSNEGHGFSSQRNHARYLEALAGFLQRHLGGGAGR